MNYSASYAFNGIALFVGFVVLWIYARKGMWSD